jgi:hypothetical protein
VRRGEAGVGDGEFLAATGSVGEGGTMVRV